MVLIKIMVIMMFMVVTTINIIITITTSVDDNARSTHSMNSSSAPCRLLPQVTCHPVKLVTKKLLPRQENATMVNKKNQQHFFYHTLLVTLLFNTR